jgi:hypothetical protein
MSGRFGKAPGLAGTLCSVIALGYAAISSAEISLPSVTGPLPISAGSYPFGSAAHTWVPTDLAAVGYAEEEYLVSGTANVYDWPEPGPAVVRTPDALYTTRILVRRPTEAERFSGTVIVEMLNPSNSFDLNIGWGITQDEIMRSGHAWVGITAKPVSIVTLKAFDPERYADISFANPLPLNDPRNCENVSGDSARTTENGLIWDVHRQVASLLRSADPGNPLSYGAADGTQPVRHLIALGYSQTGGFLYTYINALHELDVAALGRPLFDAYYVAVASRPTGINQCAPRIDADDLRSVIRADVGVPIIRIMTQSDYLNTVPLPNSNTPPNLTRNYEVAGSAHATPDELYYGPAPADIEKGGRTVPAMACDEGPRSRFPNSIAFNAALRNLVAWVRDGVPPPIAEPIMVENGQPVLDEFGNVRGGVRSPYVDVPTSTWSGNSTGASFCFIAGHEVPFSRDQLRTLYADHATYVSKLTQNVFDLVRARFVTLEDGNALIHEAIQARVP